MLTSATALFGLFASAFLSATVLPGSSEIVLVGLIAKSDMPVGLLLAAATLGNVAGAVLNWLIGRGMERFRSRSWFPVPEEKLERATSWYRRWGQWSLLLSWVPLVGDALTVAAGVLREPLPSFLLLVTLAKGGRYCVVAAGAMAVF